MPQRNATSDPNLTRNSGLGIVTLSALVIANMVGAGVFTSSGFSIGSLGNPGRVMLAWWLCGVWAICGAVAYGGLVSRLPMSGGEYLFLSRFVHPSLGFLAGWISVIAGFTAPIALAAQGAAAYILPSTPQGELSLSLVAGGVIVFGMLCHMVGIAIGAGVQNAIVFAKLLMLSLIIGWAFLWAPDDIWQGGPLPGKSAAWLPESFSAWTVLVGSMSWVALSYTGFNAAIYVAGEARDARRTVPRSMLLATLSVTAIYLLLNYVFVYVPVPESIQFQKNVASIAGHAVGGDRMEWLIRITIVLAMVSSVFAMLLTGPRVYRKMAEDGVMPKIFKSEGSPRWAIAIQALFSLIAIFVASLLELMTYLGLTLSACGALTVISLWWVRRKLPDAHPLRWWETAAMLIYLTITVLILAASWWENHKQFMAMIATFALGLVLYAVTIIRERSAKIVAVRPGKEA